LMKLIQLPTQAFEQRLSEELNENPAPQKCLLSFRESAINNFSLLLF
jgi:hypothetical protein